MKEYRYSSTILDLNNRWRYVISFRPRPLLPPEIAPGSHWIGAGQDAVENRNILPLVEIEPRPSTM
jgi:hypothetical protein